jgi:hypothetical protein
LDQVYHTKLAFQRELRSQHSPHTPSLSTSASCANLHKTGNAYRAVALDIIERAPPLVDEPLAPWPTRWNELDKHQQLELDDDDRLVRFTHKMHDEVASVRADYPMPRQCGIYYYEVTVVSKSKDT